MVFSRRNAQSSINPFDTSVAQSGLFGSLANRAQRWLGGRPNVYGEVSPASEDDDSGSETDTTMHHVFDVVDSTDQSGSANHQSHRHKMTIMKLGGISSV